MQYSAIRKHTPPHEKDSSQNNRAESVAQTLLIISTKLMSDTNAASSSNAVCASTVDMPVDVDALVSMKRGRSKADLIMHLVGSLVG